MRRKAETQIEAPGQDSFLDVVCNLVGILIVLVMLIAAQAKRGMIAAATAKPASAASSAAEAEITTAESAVWQIESNVNELQAKIDREKLEAALREEERGQFQLMVNIAEQRLAEYRSQLSDDEKARYDLERDLVSSKSELSILNTTQVSLTKPKPHVLEHLPTPMARTVFGSELHLRLLGHRLAYVPFEEMKAAFNSDAPRQLSKMRDTPRATPARTGKGRSKTVKSPDHLEEDIPPVTIDLLEPAKNGDPANTV